MANNKPPQKKVPFVGAGSIPAGYILGRVDPGVGPVQLLTLQKAQAGGLAPTSLPPSGPAGGDLGGTYPNPSVVALQGRAVVNTAPTDKYVLTWVAANSDWEPKPIPVTGVGFYSSYFNDGTNAYAALVNSASDPEIIVDGSGVPIYVKL